MSKYDVVVIGGGLAGLTAATALAQKGRRVAVCEKNEEVGGNCTDLAVDGFRFDRAVHEIDGIVGDGWAAEVLNALGVSGGIEFIEIDPMCRAFYPEMQVEFPLDGARLLDSLVELFPHEKKGLYAIKGKIDNLVEIFFSLGGPRKLIPGGVKSRLTMSTLRKLPAAAYWIFRSSRRTFRGILDAELSDERLKAIVSTLWVYAGLPPGRVFGLQVAGMLMSYGVFKPYYPRGGSGRLPLRLRDALIEAGGEVITGRAVAGLRVEGGRARGAELKGGDLLEADDVVGACDLNHLLDDLGAGRAMKPAYTERIHGLRPSVSPFRLFLGVEVGRERLAGIGFENLIFNSWDHERMYDRHLEMDIPFACVTVPSLIDEAAAPPGCQVVQIMTFAPYAEEEAWEKRKEEYARRLYDFVLQAIPGLAGPVRARLVLTPHDLRSRTNVTRGAMYGWEQSPEQSARGRPAQRTPLPGLYLAGQWTAPGPGCSQVLLSGLRAAHLIGKKR